MGTESVWILTSSTWEKFSVFSSRIELSVILLVCLSS